MELSSLLDICKKYADLGSAVQEQLVDACDERSDECNPNALDMIKTFLARVQCATNDEELSGEIANVLQDINDVAE